MSTQTSPSNPGSYPNPSSSQEILQSNHQILWQNFGLSILNHISYTYRAQKMSSQRAELWVKQEIQGILKWISNPKNRSQHQKYKLQEYRWGKQRKQWQTTFQKQLTREQEIKHKYEQLLSQAERKYKKLESHKEELAGKNSVLQSLIKSYQLKFNWKTFDQLQGDRYLVSCDRSFEESEQAKQEENGQRKGTKQDSATMTIQLLPTLNPNCDNCSQTIYRMSTKQAQTENNERVLPKSLKICSPFELSINGRQKNIISIQVQTEPKHLRKESIVFNLQFDTQSDRDKQKEITSKRQTTVAEYQYNHEDLDDSCSSSSSSSDILQCDRGTQTILSDLTVNGCQTQPLPQKIDKINQSVLASLLVKLSQLQADIESKSLQINEKNKYIIQIEKDLDRDRRQTLQLKSQIKIATQIELHMSEKYEQGKEKYRQLQEKYQEVLQILSNYISEDSRPATLQQSTQTEQIQVKIQSQFIKSESQDDQPLTTESEYLEHFNPISMVEKSTIVRYLLEFIKIQIDGGNIEKKAAVLITLLSALEIKLQEESVLQNYMTKVNYHTKVTQNQERNNGIQQKLFKYLTDQN